MTEKQCIRCGGAGHYSSQCPMPAAGNDNLPTLPRVYIAGPMSGMPDMNYPAFNAAAANLRQLGYQVENPAECGLPLGSEWHEFMRAGITKLMLCDAIVMLPGWEKSRGATAEHTIACMIEIPTMTLRDAVEHGLVAREVA